MLEIVKNALASVPTFYYQLSRVKYDGASDDLTIEDEIDYYERRFQLILFHKLATYFDSNEKYNGYYFDGEIPKRYMYGNPDDYFLPLIEAAEILIKKENLNPKYFLSYPDLVFHLDQKSMEEKHQLLVVEIKMCVDTAKDNVVLWDIVKLNFYIEKFNFQCAILLLASTDVQHKERILDKYKDLKLFRTKKSGRIKIIVASNPENIEIFEF